MTSAAAHAASALMCGGLYESYWDNRPSLDVFLRDAELIQEFVRVDAEFAKAAR